MACDTGDQSRFPGDETYQSKPIAFLGSRDKVQPFDLTFLNDALASMFAPRLVGLKMRLQASNVNVVNGPYPAKQLGKIFSRFFIKDAQGPRYDLRGHNHVEIEYQERLNPQLDVDIADGDDLDIYFHIPIVPFQHPNPKKARWELPKLMKGGQFTIGTISGAVAANDGAGGDPTLEVAANGDGSLELWADVVDEGEDESKERIVYRDFPLTAAFDTHPIVGRLRYAFMSLGEDSPAASVWDQDQQLTSRSMRMNSIPGSVLTDKYLYNQAPIPDRSDATPDSDDGVRKGKLLPVYTMRRGQGMTELIELKSLDLKTDAAFNSGTFQSAYGPHLIASWVEDRADASCEAGGMIQLANGKQVSIADVAPDLRNKLATRR